MKKITTVETQYFASPAGQGIISFKGILLT
jgi:hypothetical protein